MMGTWLARLIAAGGMEAILVLISRDELAFTALREGKADETPRGGTMATRKMHSTSSTHPMVRNGFISPHHCQQRCRVRLTSMSFGMRCAPSVRHTASYRNYWIRSPARPQKAARRVFRNHPGCGVGVADGSRWASPPVERGLHAVIALRQCRPGRLLPCLLCDGSAAIGPDPLGGCPGDGGAIAGARDAGGRLVQARRSETKSRKPDQW
jgi:hypothetical protein